jgi:hypothetical protein
MYLAIAIIFISILLIGLGYYFWFGRKNYSKLVSLFERLNDDDSDPFTSCDEIAPHMKELKTELRKHLSKAKDESKEFEKIIDILKRKVDPEIKDESTLNTWAEDKILNVCAKIGCARKIPNTPDPEYVSINGPLNKVTLNLKKLMRGEAKSCDDLKAIYNDIGTEINKMPRKSYDIVRRKMLTETVDEEYVHPFNDNLEFTLKAKYCS